MSSESSWPYTIKEITASQEKVIITYSLFDRLYTGRATTPLETASEETIRAAIEADIDSLRPKLEQLIKIISEWKGETFHYQLK